MKGVVNAHEASMKIAKILGFSENEIAVHFGEYQLKVRLIERSLIALREHWQNFAWCRAHGFEQEGEAASFDCLYYRTLIFIGVYVLR